MQNETFKGRETDRTDADSGVDLETKETDRVDAGVRLYVRRKSGASRVRKRFIAYCVRPPSCMRDKSLANLSIFLAMRFRFTEAALVSLCT